MKIAIVGSGIAGLTCAYLLNRRHEVTVFEAGDWVGGHTHTVPVTVEAASMRWTPASSCSTTGPTRTSSACSASSAWRSSRRK
jgi:predicted NAD/FAD-dependent oxidoreductase